MKFRALGTDYSEVMKYTGIETTVCSESVPKEHPQATGQISVNKAGVANDNAEEEVSSDAIAETKKTLEEQLQRELQG